MNTLIIVVKHCCSFPFEVALLLTVAAIAGCSKAPSDNDAQITAAAAAGPAAPVSQPPPGVLSPKSIAPAPLVVSENGSPEATLRQLSLELRKYVMRTRSVPENFEEFAASARIQFPPPPAGKKYTIENQAVVLVKR